MKGRDLQEYGSLEVGFEEENVYHSSCVVVPFWKSVPFWHMVVSVGAGDGHYSRLQVE